MSGSDKDDFLIIAAVDGRVDFTRDLIGLSGEHPSAAELEEAAKLKGIVFAAIAQAVESGLAKSRLGIWSESELGQAVLLRGRAMSMTTVASVERQGRQHFQFSDALDFTEQLKRIGASFAGARVNHNIEGDLAESEAHIRSLRRLSEISRSEGPPLLLELNIPPTEGQLANLDGEDEWQADFRPAVLMESIRSLQDHGVEPAIWAFEPPPQPIPASAVVSQALVDDRVDTRVLFTVGNDRSGKGLESGWNEQIDLAARTVGVGGLVLGPATYVPALKSYLAGKSDYGQTVSTLAQMFTAIAGRYVEAGTALDVS